MNVTDLMKFIENDINGYFYTRQGDYELYYSQKDKWTIRYFQSIEFKDVDSDNILLHIANKNLNYDSLLAELNSTASSMALYYKSRYEECEKLFGKSSIEAMQHNFNGICEQVKKVIDKKRFTLIDGDKH